MKAAIWGSLEITELLIEVGANINIKNKYGESSLDLAQLYYETKIINLLKEAGAQ